jgi:hypothetical protein
LNPLEILDILGWGVVAFLFTYLILLSYQMLKHDFVELTRNPFYIIVTDLPRIKKEKKKK